MTVHISPVFEQYIPPTATAASKNMLTVQISATVGISVPLLFQHLYIVISKTTPPGESYCSRLKNHKQIHLKVRRLTLSLFVLRVFTDYSDASLSLNNFALFANRFHWWSNLHGYASFHHYCRLYTSVKGHKNSVLTQSSFISITSASLKCKH